ncbi:MAG: DUF58 domain-containing protein [Planctomycetota bacterium]|jgi:uncharacterized protein (DUF58 family)
MRPSPRAVLLLAAGLPVALLPALFGTGLWVVWPAFLGLAVLAGGVDLVLGRPAHGMRVDFDVPDTLFIGDRGVLKVDLSTGRAMTFEALLELSGDLEDQPLTQVAVGPTGRALVEIPLIPQRRGTASVDALWLRWSGPLGLVRRQWRVRIDEQVGIVPNVRAVRHAALRFFSQREFLAGLKVERYVGDGSEFESMREYVPGLDHRAMNWKVSARHRRLIVQEFRAERNHQVVLALDTGHLMADPLEGIPKLDHSINAGLLLAYVCLRTGDRVGWFTFDEKVRSFSKPEGGVRAFRRIQVQSSDIEYSQGETNFTLALSDLQQRLRRRSLVVVLSDFVDTVTAELMLDSLARLSRRHLVLFVTLRDPSLDAVADAAPRSLDHMYRSVVAADFVRERDVVLRRLRRLGVHCLDVAPSEVTTGLLNRYLEIKRREMF